MRFYVGRNFVEWLPDILRLLHTTIESMVFAAITNPDFPEYYAGFIQSHKYVPTHYVEAEIPLLHKEWEGRVLLLEAVIRFCIEEGVRHEISSRKIRKTFNK